MVLFVRLFRRFRLPPGVFERSEPPRLRNIFLLEAGLGLMMYLWEKKENIVEAKLKSYIFYISLHDISLFKHQVATWIDDDVR